MDWLGQLGVPEEGRQELEEGGEELGVHWPALLLGRQGQDPPDENTMRHHFQPGVGKPGSLNRQNIEHSSNQSLTSYLGWSENVEHVAVGCQDLEVDGLQDLVWRIQFQEKHDENAVIWNLLELGGSHVVIYQEHAGHNAEDLVEKIDLSRKF